MFDNFPKKRSELPADLKNFLYSTYYKLNREGETAASSLSQKMEEWLHKKVAQDTIENNNLPQSTLELGAGTLNQLKYEKNITKYDVVEPFKELYQNSNELSRVNNVYSDISEVPKENQYDRVTSIAVLEHITNLPEVVARSGLLLGEDGTFRASIPSEGTFLWTLGWKLTTGLEFKFKYGYDYNLVVEHEHINTADEIEEVVSYFFDQVSCKVFGISKKISFYRYYECKKPNITRCREYLQSIS